MVTDNIDLTVASIEALALVSVSDLNDLTKAYVSDVESVFCLFKGCAAAHDGITVVASIEASLGPAAWIRKNTVTEKRSPERTDATPPSPPTKATKAKKPI